MAGDVVAQGADGKKVGVISTINGDANIGLYKEGAAADFTAETLPVVAFAVGEEELSGLDTTDRAGYRAAWNHFMTTGTPENAKFIADWKAFLKDDKRVTDDPMEAHWIGFNIGVNAMTAAGATHVDGVRAKMRGRKFPNLTGGITEMLPNHHLTKPVLIGEIRADGPFDILSQTEPVPGYAQTDFLPESSVLESNWHGLCNMQTNSSTRRPIPACS